MWRWLYLLPLVFLGLTSPGQTLGGNAVFNFVQQPASAQQSALGGLNISSRSDDVSLAFHNPSLMRKTHHAQVSVSSNFFVAGIRSYSLTSAYHLLRTGSMVGIGINYFNYGQMPQTDPSGNDLGTFSASDYLVQVMASQQHKERWHYGATFKFIHSGYGAYRSSGVAVDAGITYSDTTAGVQAAIMVKNIGTQLRKYDAAAKKEELPFDLQAGISKQLKKAPIQFSLTAHHLHRFNIFYNDTSFLAAEGADDFSDKRFTLQKLITHLVLSSQIVVKDKIELTVGYNFLRRNDLNVLNAASGLNGLSFGAGLLLRDLQFRYATGFYQRNMFNHFGINYKWN